MSLKYCTNVNFLVVEPISETHQALTDKRKTDDGMWGYLCKMSNQSVGAPYDQVQINLIS